MGSTFLLAALISAAAASATTAPPVAADWRTPDAENMLVIDTSKGRVIVELIPEVAPEHVARIKTLARKGTYDGRVFFRVIDRFMAQTGDPDDTGEGGSDLPDLKAEFTFRRDAASPFKTAAGPSGTEEGFVKSLPVISQAWSWHDVTSDGKVAAWGSYCPGVVGMARSEEPDSGNSQFFLMRQPYMSLDKRYTAFGRVVSGMEVVRAIKTGEPVAAPQDRMDRVRVLADIAPAERPAVRIVDPTSAWFETEIQRVRKLKGADFSLCDVTIPVEVN
ncbi:MAG: peptidylprolyl isomerase [Caulobacter sp.]|nr:peptidylprolyl isomerase [Caulobacter sp.]